MKNQKFRIISENLFAQIIRIVAVLLTNKIVAIYLGPTGVALLGQFQNFTNIILAFATAGISTGITKYIAENQENSNFQKKYIHNGIFLVFFASFLVFLTLLIGKNFFAEKILLSQEYHSIMILLSTTIFFFSLNTFFLAVINGYKEFRNILIINVLSSIIGLICSTIFIFQYQISGAFLGIIISQIFIFLLTIYKVKFLRFFSKNFFQLLDKQTLINLLKYSLMTFVSIFSAYFVQFLVRNLLISQFPLTEVGFWDGIIRICDLYVYLFTATLGIYYLPKLVELKTVKELHTEVKNTYFLLIPILIISNFLIFLTKNFVIEVLFSPTFLPMQDLFLFHLIGNIFKLSSWILSFLMLAKNMVKMFIFTEIFFGISYYFLTFLFTNAYGIQGTALAFCLNYFLYFCVMIFVFRKILFYGK